MRLRRLSPSNRIYAARRASRLILAVGWLALTPGSHAHAQSTASEYLRSRLDQQMRYGTAGVETEGVLEVRGVIQGKLSSHRGTVWMIRGEFGDSPPFQFLSAADLPQFAVGMRVCALGRGVSAAGATVELLAMIPESQIVELEKSHARAIAPAPRKESSGVIVLNREESREPAQSPVVAASTVFPSAPAGPRPPRWREPSTDSRARRQAPTAATSRSRQALSSRGWDSYIKRYRQAVQWFNPRLSHKQADTIARSILAFSIHYRIDPRLVVAVIAVESGFTPTARSYKGAMGLGQLMPGTASGLGVRNAYDPVQNIYGAVRLLRGHLGQFSGRPFWEQIALALASYNAGSGAVRKYGGVPPYRETRRYIEKVGQLYAYLCGQKSGK